MADNMKRISIIFLALLFIVLLGILFFFVKNIITGKTIIAEKSNSLYTYTKAICNESRYCQDYEIRCQGSEVISIVPLTGAVAQFSNDWEDSRTNEEIDRLCD